MTIEGQKVYDVFFEDILTYIILIKQSLVFLA